MCIRDRAEPDDEPREGGVQQDLDRAGQVEAQQRAVHGLVGEAVGCAAEAGAGQVVHPVRPGVARQGRPRQRGGGGEGHGGGPRGGAASGQPQQRGEEQQGRLERGGQADEEARGPVTGDTEDGQEHQQHGDDGGPAR